MILNELEEPVWKSKDLKNFNSCVVCANPSKLKNFFSIAHEFYANFHFQIFFTFLAKSIDGEKKTNQGVFNLLYYFQLKIQKKKKKQRSLVPPTSDLTFVNKSYNNNYNYSTIFQACKVIF